MILRFKKEQDFLQEIPLVCQSYHYNKQTKMPALNPKFQEPLPNKPLQGPR